VSHASFADRIGSVRLSGGHDEPISFWGAWEFAPLVIGGLIISALLYGLGWSVLKRHRAGPPLPARRAWAFAGGLLAIAIALVSPVSGYSEQLFAMHMVQHMLLLLIAPPLLLLGAPLLPMLWGLPAPARLALGRQLAPGRPLARIGQLLGSPLLAATCFVVTVAIWHVPAFFDAAQGRTLTHDLEHAMFLGTALLYWWPVIHPSGGRRRLSYAKAIPYLAPPFFEGMIIGIFLTFADRPLYRTYQEMEPTWGLSVLDDQQLAGLIMWVPGGLFFLIPLIGLLIMVLNQEERRADARTT
jgi:cytochrome c oxidase assembly factor CtaG